MKNTLPLNIKTDNEEHIEGPSNEEEEENESKAEDDAQDGVCVLSSREGDFEFCHCYSMCCDEKAESRLTLLDLLPDSVLDSGDMSAEESKPKPKKGKKKKKPPSFALLLDDDDNDDDLGIYIFKRKLRGNSSINVPRSLFVFVTCTLGLDSYAPLTLLRRKLSNFKISTRNR